jgi:SpoVK/Ycf46/Vps4 family AAA+-type ATPase
VLFDELEELVQERESAPEREVRLLTTSMLPRIHELRDSKRIIFIFATNRLRTFDAAAIRLGRFDAILGIPPLSDQERKDEFEKLVRQRLAKGSTDERSESNVQTFLAQARDAGFPEQYGRMTYPDLEFVVRQVQAVHGDEYATMRRLELSRLFERARSISESSMINFNELCAKFERPKD